MIYAHTCLKCGCTREPRLIEVGAVLVINCGECLAFIRYAHTDNFPPVTDIRNALWILCLKNSLIANDELAHVYPTRTNLWRAYLELSKKLRTKLRS